MDELPREARDVLALAHHAHDPSDPSARDRVRQRVALAVAAAAGASAAGTAVASAGGAGSAVKAGLLGASTKLWLAGGVLVMSAAAVTVPRLVEKRAEKPRTVQSAKHEPVREAPRVEDQVEEPAEAPQVTPAVVVAAPSVDKPRKARAREAGGLDREMGLLREASLAIDHGQLSQARHLLAEHRRDFRAGQLRDEREGLEVLRACLAQERSAERAARAFLSAHPQAVLGARIRTACGGAP